MAWWGWIVAGTLFLAAEMLVPADFYLVFLGLSALAVGGLAGLGWVETVWLQWALFGVIAVASLLLFRSRVRSRFGVQGSDPRVDDTLVGEIARVEQHLAPGATGRVELRGATWTGRNVAGVPLTPGQRARVARVEGLLLHLVPEQPEEA